VASHRRPSTIHLLDVPLHEPFQRPMTSTFWSLIDQTLRDAYSATFDAGTAIEYQVLGILTLVVAPAALVAIIALRLSRYVVRRVAEEEALHPLILDDTAELIHALQRAEHMRDTIATAEASLQRLNDALGAAEMLLHHARHVRTLDKARRKASLLLQIVDVVSITRERAAEKRATKRHKQLSSQASSRTRAWVQQKILELATETPALAGQRTRLVAAVNHASHHHQLAREWLRLARTAHSAMVDAKRRCNSASNSEFWDLMSKNKLMATISSFDMGEARRAVSNAAEAVAELRRALPDQSTADINTNIRVPSGIWDLIVDLSGSGRCDILSVFNISALNKAARQCNRSADTLAKLVRSIDELVANTGAALRHAEAAKAAYEAPFAAAALALVPNRLRPLINLS